MIPPPGPAKRLLARVLREDPAAPAILGDLQEDFFRTVESRGPTAARVWYWREALTLALGHLAHRIVRALRRDAVVRTALVEDATQAVRMLRRSPGFSLFIGAVIGLGVAAVTTVFSVLKPLAGAPPFDDADELVWIANRAERGDSSLATVSQRTVNLIDFRERAASFAGITGYDAFFASRAYTLTGAGDPERLVGVGVAHDFLEVLRVEPLLGRSFTAAEGRAEGPRAVILTHGFWRDRFASEPGVVGRTLVLNDAPHTVVGVLPSGFDFSSVFTPGTHVDILLPFPVSRDAAFQGNVLALVGRLRPGVTPEAAQSELTALVAALQQEDPERWGLGAELTRLQDHLAGPFLHALFLLAAAAGALLLVVCVNVSTVMLARSPARAREMAVRKALGAPRNRLVRQLVFETLGISLVGGALGTFLAWIATDLASGAAATRIPLMASVELDTSALLVAAGVAVLTGVLVGTVPALHVSDGREAGVLGSASRGSSSGRAGRRLREALIFTEVALACTLLVIGTLLLASFRAVLEVDLGFEPEHTVAWQLRPSVVFDSLSDRSAFYGQVAERVRAVPGVESAGLIDALPLGPNRRWPLFEVVDRPGQAEQGAETFVFPHVVDGGYREAIGTPLVAGRDLARSDSRDASPVLLLNETGARRLFGGAQGAIGGRLRFWGPWEWEVVGVVRDVRHLSPETDAGIQAYFPLAQMPDYRTMDLVVRSSLPAPQVATAVSAALTEIDPGMPTREFWSLETTVGGAVADRRFSLGVLAAFGLAALLLAGLGIYGVLAQTVAERRPEIGIRMALGASAEDVVRAVLRRMLLLTGAGIAAGWALTSLLSGLLESQLFGVEPFEPLAFLGAALALLGVAALASGLPARRAAATDAWSVLVDG